MNAAWTGDQAGHLSLFAASPRGAGRSKKRRAGSGLFVWGPAGWGSLELSRDDMGWEVRSVGRLAAAARAPGLKEAEPQVVLL